MYIKLEIGAIKFIVTIGRKPLKSGFISNVSNHITTFLPPCSTVDYDVLCLDTYIYFCSGYNFCLGKRNLPNFFFEKYVYFKDQISLAKISYLKSAPR